MFSNVLERIKANDGVRTIVDESSGQIQPRQRPPEGQITNTQLPLDTSVGQSDLSTDFPLPQNWLDPFLPLDNFEWYDQNSAWLGYVDPQIAAWPM
jgi:hypothetical protein